MLYKIRDGVTVEDLGDEFMIYDAGQGAVHRVSVVGSPWLADLLTGNPVEVDESSVSHLVEAGLLEVLAGKDWSGSRRRVLAMAGSATAAVGLTTLFLPSAAAAASIVQVFADGYDLQNGSLNYTMNVYQVIRPSDGVKLNRVVVELLDENGDDATFTLSIVGGAGDAAPLVTPQSSGPFTGSTTRTVAGWSVNEAISITITSALIGSATVSLTWTP